MRQYGGDRLGERDETVTVRDRHVAYYVTVAAAANAAYTGMVRSEEIAVYDSEWDNLRAALAWALDRGNISQAADIALSCVYSLELFRVEHAE